MFFLGSAAACLGQVVQLPSVHQFSTDTTVSVPDYGSAYMGGAKRSFQGSTERGTPGLGRLGKNRAIGSTSSATSSSVHATVIDLAEMDERVLAAAAEKTPFARKEPSRPAVSAAGESAKLTSLSRIRAELAEEDARLEAEAEQVYKKALACEEKSEWRLARTYYLLAAQKSNGAIKERARERLLALQPKLSDNPRR